MKGLSTTIVLATAIAAVTAIIARAEPQQTRVYDANGRSVGTIVPQLRLERPEPRDVHDDRRHHQVLRRQR